MGESKRPYSYSKGMRALSCLICIGFVFGTVSNPSQAARSQGFRHYRSAATEEAISSIVSRFRLADRKFHSQSGLVSFSAALDEQGITLSSEDRAFIDHVSNRHRPIASIVSHKNTVMFHHQNLTVDMEVRIAKFGAVRINNKVFVYDPRLSLEGNAKRITELLRGRKASSRKWHSSLWNLILPEAHAIAPMAVGVGIGAVVALIIKAIFDKSRRNQQAAQANANFPISNNSGYTSPTQPTSNETFSSGGQTDKHNHAPGEKHDHAAEGEHKHAPGEKHDHGHGAKEEGEHKHAAGEKHDHAPGEKHDHADGEKHDHAPGEKHDHDHGPKDNKEAETKVTGLLSKSTALTPEGLKKLTPDEFTKIHGEAFDAFTGVDTKSDKYAEVEKIWEQIDAEFDRRKASGPQAPPAKSEAEVVTEPAPQADAHAGHSH